MDGYHGVYDRDGIEAIHRVGHAGLAGWKSERIEEKGVEIGCKVTDRGRRAYGLGRAHVQVGRLDD